MRLLLPAAALLAALLGPSAASAASEAAPESASEAASEAASALPAEAPARGVGLTLGVGVGGGSIPSGIVQLQLSRPLFLEANLGYRGGWDLDDGRYYPNLALGFGLSAQFGKRPWRNGVFVDVASTLPAGFLETWFAAGWSARVWGAQDLRSFTLDLGPAVYVIRDLPAGTDLGDVPFFVYARAAWHFPLVERGGNASVRIPHRGRGRKDKDAPDPAGAPAPAEPG